jgi:enamine deaminase RidA (YjgF/YER057c/UK114 family)
VSVRAVSLPQPAVIQPEGWPRPKGYAHGVVAEGRLVFLAGQIGWDASETFRSDDFVDQARQALENVITLLRTAGGGPEHLVRMTWYVVDKREYLGRRKELGQVYREVVGPTFPAMTAVEVSALIEDRARVEIECTAVIPR